MSKTTYFGPPVAVRTASDLAALVRSERLRQGVTQAALAARCGITRQSVHNLETQRTSPAATVLLQVLDALGIELLARTHVGEDEDTGGGHDTDLDDVLRDVGRGAP